MDKIYQSNNYLEVLENEERQADNGEGEVANSGKKEIALSFPFALGWAPVSSIRLKTKQNEIKYCFTDIVNWECDAYSIIYRVHSKTEELIRYF